MTGPGPSDSPSRGEYERRAEYIPIGPSDEFIVPLLKRWIEQTLLETLQPGQPSRVLDAGCGRQPFRLLIERLGGKYVGFDVHQAPDNAVRFLGTIDGTLPAEMMTEGPYDLVLCTEVLEHVANWPAAFANLASLLVPGGRVILTCPHFYPLHEEPYDFFRPTSYAIDWHARLVGLVPERVERLGNAWDVLAGVLANIHVLPYKRSFLKRAYGRLLRSLVFRPLFILLRRRWLHRTFDPNSSLYLANVAVLRKT